ncbi:MAG: site-2 protease family protein [Anaerolineae bacterium]|nr:site-2 protease family protein [Anaerolineae bacterium]
MWQSGSLRVARVGGIAIDIHFTFVLVLAWGAWQGWSQYGGVWGASYGLLTILLVFGAIVAHELGHSLQALAFGLRARRILLLPVGGLAQLDDNPSSAWQELLIALAGPLTSLLLALVLGGIVYLIQPFSLVGWQDTLLYQTPPGPVSALRYLFWTNVVLFFFNMLPAFPMDGGRIVRSAIALWGDYEAATVVAAWLGRIMALGMVVAGVINWRTGAVDLNPALLIMAPVVFLGAVEEESTVRRRRALLRVTAGEVCRAPASVASPWDPVTRKIVQGVRGDGQMLPVVVGERLVGIVTAQDLRGVGSRQDNPTIAHVMQTSCPALSSNDTLWVAVQEMTTSQLSTLPVVNGEKLLGVVGLHEIQQAARLARRRRR